MKNTRRSQYDISNTIDISDAYQVQQAVLDVFADVYPAFNREPLQRGFEDCNKLFDGDHPVTYFTGFDSNLLLPLPKPLFANGFEELIE